MITSRLALVAAAAGLALGLTVSPASADEGTIDYSLSGASATTQGRLNVAFGGCDPAVREGTFGYQIGTLTVSASGPYAFTDQRTPGGTSDGVLQIFGPTADPLANSTNDCVASIDDRTFFAPTLQAGVEYQVLLTTFDPGTTGNFSYAYQGPGALTVDLAPKVPIEDEVCDAEDAVPAGYTLINGTTRNDSLTGTAGNDLVHAGAGNDLVRAGGGNDILCGGTGNDQLLGQGGDDVLFGGAGNDSLDGGAGDDTIFGAAGNDDLAGGAGTDTGIDTQGSNRFTSIESRQLGSTLPPVNTN